MKSESNSKKIQKIPNLPKRVLFPPDKKYDTCVEIDVDLQLNVNICNALVAKAHS